MSRPAAPEDIWRAYISDDEVELLARAGYGKSRGLGSMPALLVIDCQHNHIGLDLPILEQLDTHPTGGGTRAWEAVRNIARLLPTARDCGVPVIYTKYCYQPQDVAFDSFAGKRGNPAPFLASSPTTEIVSEVAPQDGDLVVNKLHASAFFGTGLIRYLVNLKIDTLLVVGVSTSGCVRATAVDGVTHGYRIGVVTDCVADRIEVSHCATLLDLWMKYADLLSSDEVASYLHDTMHAHSIPT
jgi:nicotinamidase-related amidase